MTDLAESIYLVITYRVFFGAYLFVHNCVSIRLGVADFSRLANRSSSGVRWILLAFLLERCSSAYSLV